MKVATDLRFELRFALLRIATHLVLCVVDGVGFLSAEEVGVELRTSGARQTLTKPVVIANSFYVCCRNN